MAGGVTNAELLDLVATTQRNLPKGEFQTTLQHPRYHVINKWFTDDKMEVDSGTSIRRNILLDPTGNAQHVNVYERVPVTVNDQQFNIDAQWVQMLTRYSISHQELTRNREPARFVNLLTSRETQADVSLANLLEDAAWSAPVNATDDLNPFGLPYWLNKTNASTASTGDFIGQTVRYSGGTTATTIGGISTADNSHWRNWAFTYTAVDAEFVKRMRRAFHRVDFQSPLIAEDVVKGPLTNFRIYMGTSMLVEYETLVTNANDNIGSDLAPFQGNTSFRKIPIFHVPQLNSDTEDPVYGVNHEHFKPIVMQDDWMRRSEPMEDVELPNVFTTTKSGSYQYFCFNKREAGFVGSLVPAT